MTSTSTVAAVWVTTFSAGQGAVSAAREQRAGRGAAAREPAEQPETPLHGRAPDVQSTVTVTALSSPDARGTARAPLRASRARSAAEAAIRGGARTGGASGVWRPWRLRRDHEIESERKMSAGLRPAGGVPRAAPLPGRCGCPTGLSVGQAAGGDQQLLRSARAARLAPVRHVRRSRCDAAVPAARRRLREQGVYQHRSDHGASSPRAGGWGRGVGGLHATFSAVCTP
eukprot:COSAG04_NODE_2908_length_3396_cov_2.580831_1_plen_228_part_00